MKKHLLILFLSISLAAVAFGCSTPRKIVLQDDFSGRILNPELWEITTKGDFKAWEIGPMADGKGGRLLRLRANTIGTRDDTVKVIGIESKKALEISTATISFDLDWNNQVNGSYLSAGLYLVPEKTGAQQQDRENWLAVRYIGVPPGRNGRCEVLEKINGRTTVLFWEGWPEKKQGRPLSYQRVKLIFSGSTLRIEENGRAIFETNSFRPRFDRAYLYLQMSSHSNYPDREIYIDNVSVLTSGDY
jgi:hypothetical protein